VFITDTPASERDYRPVTANQKPLALPGTAGEVTKMIGAMQWVGSLTIPSMFELPAVFAANVFVKNSCPFVESVGF